MANMNLAASWHDEPSLVEYLATQLTLGRLAVVLGAGVSEFYGLPKWSNLINRLCNACGEPDLASGEDPVLKAGALKARHYKGNDAGFSVAVRTALYAGVKSDFEVIRKNDLLSAIGALAMSSSRGSASTIVTFNYDDLLELFLEYHGYVTASIDDAKHWSPRHDVVVYHPHGLLPLGDSRTCSPQIVLATSDYLSVLGPAENLWRPLLQTLFRTHTFLYIGLSGSDIHLQSLVHDLKENHAITKDRVRYHGVRFVESGSTVNEDMVTQYEEWGVFTHRVPNFPTSLPHFLFSICQAARVQRSRSP
jgi:hypothetical protein